MEVNIWNGTAGNNTLTIAATDTYDLVNMRGGNDTVHWNGGMITGHIDGNAGYDRLNLTVADGVINLTYDGTSNAGTLTYDGNTVSWATRRG